MVSGHTSPARMFQLVVMPESFQRDALESQKVEGKNKVSVRENLGEWREWEGFLGSVVQAAFLAWGYHKLWQRCLVHARV